MSLGTRMPKVALSNIDKVLNPGLNSARPGYRQYWHSDAHTKILEGTFGHSTRTYSKSIQLLPFQKTQSSPLSPNDNVVSKDIDASHSHSG